MQLTADQVAALEQARRVLAEPVRQTDPPAIGWAERAGALSWRLASVIDMVDQLTSGGAR